MCWDRGNTQYSSHTDSVWSPHVTIVIRLRVMRWFVIRNVDWYVVCVQSSVYSSVHCTQRSGGYCQQSQ